MVDDWHILRPCDRSDVADIKGSVTLGFHNEFLTVFVLVFFSSKVRGFLLGCRWPSLTRASFAVTSSCKEVTHATNCSVSCSNPQLES